MPPIINRILFVGIGEFGSNAVFELKKRLVRVNTNSSQRLISPGGNAISSNPLQFLAIPKEVPKFHMELFRRASFTGSDRYLFDQEHEICGMDKEDALSELFKKAITRIANIDSGRYSQSTGIGLSSYLPTAVFLFDTETYSNENCQAIISKLASPDKTDLSGKYHSHTVTFGKRYKKNRQMIEELSNTFYNVFLFDEESDLVLAEFDDQVDLATNFLQVAAQMDHDDFYKYFSNAEKNKYFSFGSTSIYYPKHEMILDAVQTNLGDPEFGFGKGLGKHFFSFFVGRFRSKEEKDGEHENPFTLGEMDTDSEKGAFADELFPDVRDSVETRAHALKIDAITWLDKHAERIRQDLKRETLINRVKQLTKSSFFWKIYLERWHDNFSALEFLLQKEIIHRAEKSAERLKDEFVKNWQNISEMLYDKVKKNIDDDGNVIEHNGELAWRLTQIIIEHIRDILIPQQKESESETKYQPAEPATREQVEKAMSDLPRPISLMSRLALFIALMVFFWGDVHQTIIKWTVGSDVYIPAYSSGLLFGSAFVLILYWFAYRNKLHTLNHYLSSYLAECKRKKEKELKAIENKLVLDFLFEAAHFVRSRFMSRSGFFFHVIQRGKINFNDLVGEGHSQFKDELNLTESYYLNRYRIYGDLQDRLKRLNKRIREGILSQHIPKRTGEVYRHRMENLANSFKEFHRFYLSDEVKNHEGKLMLWSGRITRSDDHEVKKNVNAYIDSIISECGKILEAELDNDPSYRDLFGVLSSMNYKFDRQTFATLSSRARSTFQLITDTMPGAVLYAGTEEFFTEIQCQTLNMLIDKNSIIFLNIDGPVEFEDIEWKD